MHPEKLLAAERRLSGLSLIGLTLLAAAPAVFGAGEIGFNRYSYSTREDQTNLVLTVVRRLDNVGEVSVDYQMVAGTALPDQDYLPQNGTLVFTNGQTTQTLTLVIVNDSASESQESFVVHLTNPTGGATLARFATDANILISDDDNPGSFQIANTRLEWGETNQTAIAAVVRLEAANGTASVDVVTRDGTARAGSDYTAVQLTLVFTNGEVRKDIPIPLLDDRTVEPTETFYAYLTNASPGVPIAIPQTEFSLVDDDLAGTMQFSAARVVACETDGVAQVVVTRTGSLAAGATVDYTTVDFTAHAGLDYLTASGTLSFGADETQQVIFILLLNDSLAEGDEEFDVRLFNPVVSGTVGLISNAVVELRDDEPFPAIGTRAGLEAAIAAGGEHRILCDALVTLTNPLVVARDVTLDASGHSFTLSARHGYRLIEVRPGAHLTLIHFNLIEGQSTAAGAILNDGAVSLFDCLVSSNRAVAWPGISGAQGYTPPVNTLVNGGPGGSGTPGNPAHGGALFNRGQLRASNCTFTANAALGGNGGGGGDGGDGGREVDPYGRCTYGMPGGVGGNGGSGGDALGGALYNEGDAELIRAAFQQNSAQGGAGGPGGIGGIQPCTMGSEAATGIGGPGGAGVGGACYNAGRLVLTASYAFENGAGGGGGGNGRPAPEENIYRVSSVGEGGDGGLGEGGALGNVGTVSLVNSTFHANAANGGPSGVGGVYGVTGCPGQGGDGGNAFGGAVFNAGPLASTNNTLWQNWARPGLAFNRTQLNCPSTGFRLGADGQASGDCVANSSSLALVNTLVGSPDSVNTLSGTQVTDLGHNLCSDGSADFTAPSSRLHTDPRLGSFADHGGGTLTFSLQASSPARDGGTRSACPTIDQRGVLRPQNGSVDIGAVEQTFLTLDRLIDGRLQPAFVARPHAPCVLEASDDFVHWRIVESVETLDTGAAPFQPLVPESGSPLFLRTR